MWSFLHSLDSTPPQPVIQLSQLIAPLFQRVYQISVVRHATHSRTIAYARREDRMTTITTTSTAALDLAIVPTMRVLVVRVAQGVVDLAAVQKLAIRLSGCTSQGAR